MFLLIFRRILSRYTVEFNEAYYFEFDAHFKLPNEKERRYILYKTRNCLRSMFQKTGVFNCNLFKKHHHKIVFKHAVNYSTPIIIDQQQFRLSLSSLSRDVQRVHIHTRHCLKGITSINTLVIYIFVKRTGIRLTCIKH